MYLSSFTLYETIGYVSMMDQYYILPTITTRVIRRRHRDRDDDDDDSINDALVLLPRMLT